MLMRSHLFVSLLLGLGVAVGLCWGIPMGVQRSSQSSQADKHPLKGALNEGLLCGPQSVAGAAARLGVWVEPKAMAARCQVSERGISMLDLKQAAPLFGLEAKGVQLNWDELVALDCPVVLYLAPKHYVCIDPREPSPAGKERQLHLYDYPNPARWVTKAELCKTWSGEALVLSRGTEEHQPALAFETLLEDFGGAYSQDTPVCTFRLRNKGRQVVKILDVKKSCGCTEVELNRTALKPGEDARLTVAINLKGRQGVQRQVVFMRTSDQTQPVVPLTIQGLALSPVHISTDAIDLGTVSPGQRVAYDFIVTDRNMGLMKLTTSTYASEETRDRPAVMDVEAAWQATDRTADEWLDGDSAKPEWRTIIRGKGNAHYRVSLTARIASSAAPGMHQGKLILATNDPHNPMIKLPLLCMVAPGGQHVPERVSLGVVRPNQVARRTIPLAALGLGDWNAPAGELRLVSTSGGPLQPRATLRRGTGQDAVIDLELDPRGAPADSRKGLLQGIITFKGPKGPLTIPWMCFAKHS